MFKFSIRQWLSIMLLMAVLALGLWFWLKTSFFATVETEKSTIMLEKVKKVTKLIAVEGQYSELYTFGEDVNHDYFGLFSKKIILRVNAKVSVGYDFEKVKLTIDSLAHTVTLDQMPAAEILSIEHDIDYYDLDQGTFNEFTKEEYTTYQRKAKDLITQKAASDPLIKEASQQKEDYISMMDMALKSAGWKLIVKENAKPIK
jgi:hypothetical protein